MPQQRRGISKSALKRLVPLERTPSGRIKNYYDPSTKNVWSARQYRQARAGGVTGEERTAIRTAERALPKVREVRKRATRQRENIQYLVKAYQERERIETGKRRSKDAILKDPNFWRAVEDLTARGSKSPTGKRARAMEEFGLRPRNASWKVGQSPKKQKR